MKKVIKTFSLFVGTVIGAGFASGKEVAVYFDGLSPLIALLSGILLGIFCGLFMFSGKKCYLFYPKWFATITFFCSAITLSAMCAGAESLILPLFPFGGLITLVLSVVIALLGIKPIKTVNSILVPLIIIGILFLFFKNGKCDLEGSFLPFKPISYSCLNLLIAANLMANEGKSLTTKEIILTSSFCAVFMSLMLFAIAAMVIGNSSTMPLLDIATSLGYPQISAILIFIAIFTTMVSSAKLMLDELIKKTPSKLMASVCCLVLSYPLSLIGFNRLITYGYPVVSYMGLIQLLGTICKRFFGFKHRNYHHRNYHQNHLRCHRLNTYFAQKRKAHQVPLNSGKVDPP